MRAAVPARDVQLRGGLIAVQLVEQRVLPGAVPDDEDLHARPCVRERRCATDFTEGTEKLRALRGGTANERLPRRRRGS